MTILSSFVDCSRSGLCGLLLMGAAAGCSPDDGATNLPDLGMPTTDDAGVMSSNVDTVNLAADMSLITFDDSLYSSKLHKVVVPGAATGNLFLIDPDTLAVSTISGFAKPMAPPNGGITSVTEGNGLLYVTNQTDNKLYVADPATGMVVYSVALGGSPDYVRYTATTNELWVTEPDVLAKIEILSLKTDVRKPRHSAYIAIAGGPEGLAIDDMRKVAYTTSMANSMTQVIDLQKRTVTTSWASGCVQPKGILADQPDGLALFGCGEGGASVVNAAQGKAVSRLKALSTADSLGYSPMLRHLYIPGSNLVVASVSTGGTLSELGKYPLPGGATKHALADESGHAWVLLPSTGQILRVSDGLQASQ
jgi:YVTN family beta-propeller protein